MNPAPFRPSLLIPLLLATGAAASAADIIDARGDSLSLVPQLLIGTSDVEPGLAVEYRPATEARLIVRPEVFISEDGRLGAGGSVLWDFRGSTRLPDRQSLAFGPRVVYHNSDDHGLEIDAMGVYGFDLGVDRPWRHSLEAIAAVGAVHDRKHDDSDIGITVGGAYAFRF